MGGLIDFFITLYNYQQQKYKILLLGLGILFFVAFILLILIIRTRTQRDLAERRFRRIKTTLENTILSIVFQADLNKRTEQIKTLKKLFENKKNTVARDAAREILRTMALQLDGESLEAVTQIYRETNLKELLLQELNDKSWDVKAAIIEEIGDIRLKELLFEVLKYTDYEVEIVRNRAQVVVLKLGGMRGLEFLNTLKSKISEWQQIQLLNQLLKLPYNQYPRTKIWLSSSNDSVVMFGLKVTQHFQQYQDKEELIKLLDHQNTEIVKKTIKVFTHLGLKNELEKIKLHYPNYSIELKVEVLKAIGELGDESDHLFLFDCMMSDDYFIVKEASKSMLRIGQKNLLYQIKDSFPDYQREIIEHSLDERI
ncbi:hypothetical protein CEN47_28765 [Fischerella thermalis CCMEE 5319]|nr:hypothetical protein CEN47_28765 [Fischerella thermalis CCMEE 5319]